MIFRTLSPFLKETSKKYPVLTITGPRQSGKTTLCRTIFKKLPYVSMEDPDTRLQAQSDPRGFLSHFSQGAVLDEIQRVPEIVSYLQSIVDEPKNKKKFVLSGSQNLILSQTISQSLAGRTAIFQLLPFSMQELHSQIKTFSTDRLLLTGFYPRIYDKKLNPTQALASYFETYVERDLRGLSNIHNLSLFQKFMKLCAGRVGQILNLSALGNEVGVSAETARQWMSLLQATYIVYLLPPYYRNFNKRIVKSPKLYFYDVGLAAYLLGIISTSQMSRDPLRGALFENLVVLDILKTQIHQNRSTPLYYFRDNNGNEVDLLFDREGTLYSVEIKASQTVHSDFFRGLHTMQKITAPNRCQSQLIYGGRESRIWSGIHVRSYRHYYKTLFEFDAVAKER